MKRKLLSVFLSVLAIVSLAMATLSVASADDAEPVYSYNFVVNGDFETSEAIGATAEYAQKFGNAHYFGNFFGGYNFGAGTFNTNQRVLPTNVNVTLENGKGVDGSKAIKVVYNGIGDGFGYRLVNTQQNTVLARAGKTYNVSVQHMVDVDKNPCGPQLTLSFFYNDGSAWTSKQYVISTIIWGHTANVWETIGGTFGYDLTEEGGVKTCKVTYTSAGVLTTDSFTYGELAYIDVLLACYVGGDVTNEVYYDNMVVEEAYSAKIQVTDENADPIDDIADKFTVNGKAVTPVYENGMYVFSNLTGENEIRVNDDSLGLLNSSVKVYGDRSVLTKTTEDRFWTSYAENTESRSFLFGQPRYQDITVSLKDDADNPLTGALLDAGEYAVEETGNGTYLVKNVLQTAPEFSLSIKASGCYPVTVKMDGSTAEKSVTMKAVEEKSENLIVNGDFENEGNFAAHDVADPDGKWRPISDKGTLALGGDVFSGLHAMDLTLTASGGDCGIVYRIPADGLTDGTWYSFGARVKAAVPSVNYDAVYAGFVPVLRLTDGSVMSWEPYMDFGKYLNDCGIAECYPLVGWQNLSGILSVSFNSDKHAFTFTIKNKEMTIPNVEEVVGYDIYFVFSNGDSSESYTINLDRVTLAVAVGYTGIDLGNDASNILPNGDFENASTIRENYVTYGYWSEQHELAHVEQSGDYAKNGMSSLKATLDKDAFLQVRTECFAGKYLNTLTVDNFTIVKPGVFHQIHGYAKSGDAGATFSVDFMITYFQNGLYTDQGVSTGATVRNTLDSYVFTESDALDGEWIELSATFYYTVDCATGSIKAWFNKTDVSGDPDFIASDVTEFHALDIAFSSDRHAEVYLDLWSLYAEYDATVTVLGEDGNATTDKTLVLKDFFGNDVTADYDVTIEGNVYKINGVYGALTVSVEGDDSYPAQTVSSVRPARTLEKPYSYTLTVKDADNRIFPKDAIQISVKQEGADVGFLTWNEDGSFTITGLTGNNVTVSIMAEGYKNGNVTINAQGSGELTLELDVKPAFNVIVTVKDENNNPVNDAKVEIRRGDAVVASATSGRNGTYTLTGVNDDVAGDLVVVVTRDGYTFETGKTVSRGASTVQITGTSTGSQSTGKTSGCGGAVDGVSLLSVLVLLAGVAFVASGKKIRG